MIKSEVNERVERKISYPCLMKSDIMIVLMDDFGCGTILKSKIDSWPVGRYVKALNMDKFSLLKGKITLSNA